MGVRPRNGLVPIARYPERLQADTAVALLSAAGIEAEVLGGHAGAPPGAVPGFSVLVPIAIADDANQVVVRAGGAPVRAPAPLPAARLSPPAAPDDPDLDDLEDFDDADHERSAGRPRWVKVVAWLTAGSVLLPLLAGAAHTVSQL